MAYSGSWTEEQEGQHISGPEDTKRNKPKHNRAEERKRDVQDQNWMVDGQR